MSLPSRDRLVFAAMDLFHAQGYEATSVDQVLRRASVNSGSMYYHFKSKEDLLLGVLDAYLAGLWPIVMQPAFDRTTDPIDRVFAVLADYRQRLVVTGLTYTCPIGALALEMSERSTAVRTLVAANFAAWCDAIRGCLDAAADRLPADLDRAALASFVLVTMEGAVMQARTHRSLAPFDAAVAQLDRYVRGLLRPVSRRHAATARGRRPASPADPST